MELVLIRHAEPVRVDGVVGGAAADPALSARGVEQAIAVSRVLRAEGLDALYSSPMRRRTSGSVTTSHRHVCRLFPVGAWIARRRHSITTSRGTGRARSKRFLTALVVERSLSTVARSNPSAGIAGRLGERSHGEIEPRRH